MTLWRVDDLLPMATFVVDTWVETAAISSMEDVVIVVTGDPESGVIVFTATGATASIEMVSIPDDVYPFQSTPMLSIDIYPAVFIPSDPGDSSSLVRRVRRPQRRRSLRRSVELRLALFASTGDVAGCAQSWAARTRGTWCSMWRIQLV